VAVALKRQVCNTSTNTGTILFLVYLQSVTLCARINWAITPGKDEINKCYLSPVKTGHEKYIIRNIHIYVKAA